MFLKLHEMYGIHIYVLQITIFINIVFIIFFTPSSLNSIFFSNKEGEIKDEGKN